MVCATGDGFWIGMSIQVDAFCKTSAEAGNIIAATQSLIRAHSVLLTASGNVHGLVYARSAGEWRNDIAVFDSPRGSDGCGALMRKRKGCTRTNPPWEAQVEYNGEFQLDALIGAEGMIRRWNNDMSYREAYGFIVGATPCPNQVPGQESVGALAFQWEGGGKGDRGFVKFYNSSGDQQFPPLS